MNRTIPLAAAIATLATMSAPIHARMLAQATLETPASHIEIIGLHRWTMRMIEDSLAVYSPKDALTAHACAAILRDKLHFADASVSEFANYPNMDAKSFLAITIVEPQDSARIHYKTFRYDSLPVRAEWAAAFAAMKSGRSAQHSIQSPSFWAEHLSAGDSTEFAAVDAIHQLIVHRRSARDFEDAHRTLATDSAFANRVVAAIILGSFGDRDEAWWALADALRDPVGMVSSVSSQILGTLSKSAPRVVNWTPMATQLRYVIDGTNLFAFDRLATTLVATHVSPSLAPALLGGGGDIVRAKLRSKAPGVKDGVAQMLALLSGLPATTSADHFTHWMAGVKPR
jgi:hypothetical protein